MSALDIPEAGLSLHRGDLPGADGPPTKPTQIMRLNLAQNILDELIQSLRNDQKARIRLGKHQALYYGSKSQQFHSFPETHRSEIYTCNSADKENLYFTGLLSHSLEVQKAKEDTAATDQALANLEQSLHAFERGKESKKTHIITDIDQVRALKAGSNRPARVPPSKIDLQKDRFFNKNPAANRSLSTSPLGLSRSPLSLPAHTPTSAPLSQNKDRIRLDALKVPFIHLLAIRAVSAKFLAQKTRASLDDCLTLTQKYAVENRLNREKFDLKDKAYKELDVWNFPYPSQEDRQEAIENAISAFDRMRISRSDKLWQTLLPKEERGKGKVLSRLNLRTGPIKKSLTPRIQVQPAEDTGKEGYTTGNETDRTNNNGLAPKTAEKAAPKSVSTATAKKRRAGEKDVSTKRAPAKGKNSNNSTLTGRVTKKAERKPASKIKSAEFVHDSDEEDTDMPDATSSSSTTTQRQAEQKEKPLPKSDTTSKPVASHAAASKATKPDTQSSAKRQPSNPTDGAIASKRLPSSRLSKSTSPRKPSPLASSPPTNASDYHSHSRSSSQNTAMLSSSSSSPLITQVSKPRKPTGTTTTSAVPKPTKPNNVVKSVTETTVPSKRKAESERPPVTESRTAARANGHVEHKRQRAASVSSGSTGSDSPSLNREFLLQQLREKSQRFKQYYAKYRSLHDSLASHPNPPRAELDRLHQQHVRLQRMKKEIWDEDRRLREKL